MAAVVVVGGVDQGVPGVTRGRGDGCGEGNGHEAETFALQVLHGRSHVFLHELRHLLLRHVEALVRRRRRFIVAVRAPWMDPAVGDGVSLGAVTASLQNTRSTTWHC